MPDYVTILQVLLLENILVYPPTFDSNYATRRILSQNSADYLILDVS